MRFLALLLLVSSFTACTNKPAGPLAFVTNERDGTITVIDTNTDRVTSTLKVGGRLRGIRLSPNRDRIWVAISYPTNEAHGEDTIAEIDINGNVIAKYDAGTDPENFAIDNRATRLYIANEDAGTASVSSQKARR
jgi:YVTN family beta-propeller protein